MRLCIFLVFLFFLLKCIECLLTLITISILSQNAFFFYCFSHLLYFFKYFLKKSGSQLMAFRFSMLSTAVPLLFSNTILDRIAEVVKSFPCLYFRVRLTFRHRLVYVRLSQMRSAFLASLSGGVQKFYCVRSPLCRPS